LTSIRTIPHSQAGGAIAKRIKPTARITPGRIRQLPQTYPAPDAPNNQSSTDGERPVMDWIHSTPPATMTHTPHAFPPRFVFDKTWPHSHAKPAKSRT